MDGGSVSTALEIRTRKLSERANEIRNLEARELEAKCRWAFLAVQLGTQYRESKYDWEQGGDVRNPGSQWMKWLVAHTRYKKSTIYEYIAMADRYDAATQEQKDMLLAQGSIRGFHDAVEAMQNSSALEKLDDPKSFPPETSVLNGFGRWWKQAKNGPAFDTWSEGSREAFKGQLVEVTRATLTPEEVWPEKFSAQTHELSRA